MLLDAPCQLVSDRAADVAAAGRDPGTARDIVGSSGVLLRYEALSDAEMVGVPVREEDWYVSLVFYHVGADTRLANAYSPVPKIIGKHFFLATQHATAVTYEPIC